MRVYISGPITGNEDYKGIFAEAERQLTELGYIAVNPAKIAEMLPDGEHEEYIKLDMALLSLCDAIYMLPGWQQSRGANREYGFALGAGKKIMEDADNE